MSMYLNIWDYITDDYPFNIFIGSRGCGKTYSALTGITVGNKLENGRKFIYMRRTLNELELVADSKQGEGANPFKPINDDNYTNFGFTSIVPHLLGVYNRTINDNGSYAYEGQPIGYGVSLSSIAKIRGLSFEDCDILIYDEFIKEKHVNKMKGEADAFFNAIETINRNRELKGRKPITVILLANSNDIYNDLLVGLNVVTECEKMIRQNKEHRYFKDRGLAIHIMKDNPNYVEKKSQTALYKLTEGTSFNDMALHNSFAYNDFSDIKHLDLKGYEPIVNLGKGCVYRKKGERRFYYCYAMSKQVPTYNPNNVLDQHAFNRKIGLVLWDETVKHNIIYETYDLKETLLTVIGLNK